MAESVKYAVPIISAHDGFHPPKRMSTLIKIYKCYHRFRPSRLAICIVAIIVLWRQHIVLEHEREEMKYVKSQLKMLNNTSQRIVHEKDNELKLPTIYAITPTFARPTQKAELTRLSQTLMLIKNLHWIIIEDAPQKSSLISNLLNETSLKYTHLNAATPSNYKLGKHDANWKKPRGVEQRNTALHWLRNNLNFSHNGIVYFADDDNSYSIKLFEEIRKVKTVGVWPVGLVGGLMVEKPYCNKETGKVTGFNAMWKPDRPFPIDMAGFAINLQLILKHPDATFSFDVPRGYQESEILRQIITKDELEPLADYCTKVYVWHTRTEQPILSSEQQLKKKGVRSNTGMEV